MNVEHITAALAAAYASARYDQKPRHIIRQGGQLRIVKTFVEGDDVIASDITAPRITASMIEAGCEAYPDLRLAMAHIDRIATVLKARLGDSAPRSEEIIADLLSTACQWAEGDRKRAGETTIKPTLFTRLFGRTAY
jgi:hypothetical protein